MMEGLPHLLQEVVRKAEALLGPIQSAFDGDRVSSLEDVLRSANMQEEDRSRRVQISLLISDLQKFLQTMPGTTREADAQIFVQVDKQSAVMTIIPPRGGRTITPGDVLKELERRGIKFGVNYAAVEAACKKVQEKEEIVYGLIIAQAKPPTKGRNASLDQIVPVFDKSRIFSETEFFAGELVTMIHPVEQGTHIGTIWQALTGTDGVDVQGGVIPALKGDELPLRLGDGVRVAQDGREIYAVRRGAVVSGGGVLEVVPFYIIREDLNGGPDITFDGNVLIAGTVYGPMTITARDIYIAGNLENATIVAQGDVFVQGSVVGKRQTVIECDGRLFARTVSDAQIRAIGDVLVRNSLTYCDVLSNGRVILSGERGWILGGQVCALREIFAHSIGSDFGTFTSIVVGKDFLTGKRLGAIDTKIRVYEESLAKIESAKARLAAAKVDARLLPPDKQDIYISILEKEKLSREELESLRQRRLRFSKAIADDATATIRVLENLFPPVKIQACDTVQEIEDKLFHVVIALDRQNGKLKVRTLEDK